MKQTMDSYFGQLRSMLQAGVTKASKDVLVNLLRRARALDEERYADEFVSYMQGFSFPEFKANSLLTLENMSSLLPEKVTFALDFATEETEEMELDVQEVMRHPALSRVSSLSIFGEMFYEVDFGTFVEETPLPMLKSFELLGELETGELPYIINTPWISQLETLRLYELYLEFAEELLLIFESTTSLSNLTLSYVEFEDEEKILTSLANNPAISSIASLTFSDLISPTIAEILGSSPYLENIEELSFISSEFEDGALDMLVHTQGFPKLKSLTLDQCEISSEDIQLLSSAPWLTELTKLCLNELENSPKETAFMDDGVESLIDTPILTSLHTLELAGNHLASEKIQMLANALQGSNIKRLRLDGNDVGGEGLEALSNAGLLHTLYDLEGKTLDLSRMYLTNDDLEVLAKCPQNREVSYLFLNENEEATGGVVSLFENPGFDALFQFEAVLCGLQDKDIQKLVNALYFPTGLQCLDLSANHFGVAGVDALASCARLSSLTRLLLDALFARQRDEPSTEDVHRIAKSLAESEHLTSIRQLNLANDCLDDEALTSIVNSKNFSNVEALYIDENYQLGTASFDAIANSPYTSSLMVLAIPYTMEGPSEGVPWRDEITIVY